MILRTDENLNVGMVVAILAVVGMLSAGQVLFKYAARVLDITRPATFLSLPLMVALALYGIATVCWLFVLSRVSLSTAYPFYGLVFVLVPLLSWIVLREPLNIPTLIGSAVIVVGVLIVGIGSRV